MAKCANLTLLRIDRNILRRWMSPASPVSKNRCRHQVASDSSGLKNPKKLSNFIRFEADWNDRSLPEPFARSRGAPFPPESAKREQRSNRLEQNHLVTLISERRRHVRPEIARAVMTSSRPKNSQKRSDPKSHKCSTVVFLSLLLLLPYFLTKLEQRALLSSAPLAYSAVVLPAIVSANYKYPRGMSIANVAGNRQWESSVTI